MAVYNRDVAGDQYVTLKFDDGTVLFITHDGPVSALRVSLDGDPLEPPSFAFPQGI
jgi:broad specificity phosphatase PhoE